MNADARATARRVILTALAAVLCACAASTEADRQAYLEAVHTDRADAALAACDRIGAPSLRGDCTVHAASLGADDPDAALAACDRAPEGMWRAECVFVVVEAASLTGARAVAACADSGPFRDNCIEHALRRDLEGRIDTTRALGQEQALLAAAAEALATYRAELPAARRDDMAQAIAAGVIADRWGDGPMSVATCGAANPTLCVRAYRSALDVDLADPRVAEACRRGMDAGALAELGARPWTPDSEPTALQAWDEVCRALPRRLGPRGQDRAVIGGRRL